MTGMHEALDSQDSRKPGVGAQASNPRTYRVEGGRRIIHSKSSMAIQGHPELHETLGGKKKG